MREMLRRLVEREIQTLVAAQVSAAKGIKFLVLRDRATGQFIKRIAARSSQTHLKKHEEHEVVEVWQKDPSTAAFKELMAHAIDLPKHQEEEIRLTGEWTRLVALLRSARTKPPEKP
jgi:hypothetical protein